MKEYPMWNPPTKAIRRQLRLARRSIRHGHSKAGPWPEHARSWRQAVVNYPFMGEVFARNCENRARYAISMARWNFLGRPGDLPALPIREEAT